MTIRPRGERTINSERSKNGSTSSARRVTQTCASGRAAAPRSRRTSAPPGATKSAQQLKKQQKVMQDADVLIGEVQQLAAQASALAKQASAPRAS